MIYWIIGTSIWAIFLWLLFSEEDNFVKRFVKGLFGFIVGSCKLVRFVAIVGFVFGLGIYAESEHNFYEDYGKNILSKGSEVAQIYNLQVAIPLNAWYSDYEIRSEEKKKIRAEEKKIEAQKQAEQWAIFIQKQKEQFAAEAQKQKEQQAIAAERQAQDNALETICKAMFANVKIINRCEEGMKNNLASFKPKFFEEYKESMKEFVFNDTTFSYCFLLAPGNNFCLVLYSEDLILYSGWVKGYEDFIIPRLVYIGLTDTFVEKDHFLENDYSTYLNFYQNLIRAFYQEMIKVDLLGDSEV